MYRTHFSAMIGGFLIGMVATFPGWGWYPPETTFVVTFIVTLPLTLAGFVIDRVRDHIADRRS